MIELSNLIMDIDLYADLLNSVGRQGTGNRYQRPLTPVQCAEAMQRIRDEEGDSLEQIAKRLGLGKPKDTSDMYKKRDTSQVRVFLNLLKVSPKIRNLAGWSTDEYPRIPFSTIAQLSTMTEEEQNIIVQSILKDKKRLLGKEDVKRIKKWRNENPSLSVKECVEDVLRLKPVTVTTHMVVFELSGTLRRFVDSNRDDDCEEKLLGLLGKNLVGKFHNVRLGNSVMVVSMDDEAYKVFYDSQYKKKVSFTEFLNGFLDDRIG